MTLKPIINPLQSFTWLKDFNETIAQIISGNHKGFSCEIHATKPTTINGFTVRAGKSDSAGNYTIGLYWLGFYYKLSINNWGVLPWFGCQFVDEFTIDIILTSRKKENKNLHDYLSKNEYSGSTHGKEGKLFCRQPNSNIPSRYRFDDYMKYVNGQSDFDLESWICSSQNQENDLNDFFEHVNKNHLVPHL